MSYKRCNERYKLKCLRIFLTGNRFAVLEVPLLFESGVIAPFMNKIIVVYW